MTTAETQAFEQPTTLQGPRRPECHPTTVRMSKSSRALYLRENPRWRLNSAHREARSGSANAFSLITPTIM